MNTSKLDRCLTWLDGHAHRIVGHTPIQYALLGIMLVSLLAATAAPRSWSRR